MLTRLSPTASEHFLRVLVLTTPRRELMEDQEFQVGERLWLHGEPVTFAGYYHRYAGSRPIGPAFVRTDKDSMVRVVTTAKLGRSRTESLVRETTLPVG
jgi:hypothetical protein